MIGLLQAIAVGIFIPHRIAGPLYRIERDIKDKVFPEREILKAKFPARSKDETGNWLRRLISWLKTQAQSREGEGILWEGGGDVQCKNEGNKEARRAMEKLEEAVKEFMV